MRKEMMMDDLNDETRSMSQAEKRVLAMKSRLKWWTGLLILGFVAALGLAGITFYPDLLRRVLGDEVRARGDIRTVDASAAYLGVEIQDLNEGMAEAMDLRYDGGVSITRVVPSSPAAKAGIKPGDIILQYDRSRVENSAEFQGLIAQADPEDRAKIVLDRGGQVRTFYVELGQRSSYLVQAAFSPTDQTGLEAEWGCTLSSLTPDLVQKLSLPSSVNGVVVVAVAPAGLAKDAGLQPGDVIVSVNREPTQDLAHFYEAIEDQRSVVLGIYRSGRVVYQQVQIGSALPPLATIAGSLTEDTSVPERVAVAASGNDLNAQTVMLFGTAPYFLIVDLDANRFHSIQNNTLADSRGYGIAAAQLVAAQGAEAAVAGAYGPQAYDALKSLNITPFIAKPAKISDVLVQYRSGLLAQVTEPTLPGYGYARSIIPTGGSPFSEEGDQEEEEQSGYKGVPYTIPPQGKYDPALDPANTLQKTAGTSQRTEYCYCPSCRILIPHPAGVSCSDLTCPQCGNRLMNWDSGALAPSPNVPSPDYPQAPVPSQSQLRVGATGAMPSPGSVPGTTGTLNLNQQNQYCYCPICNTIYEHPPGVPCYSLVCPNDGSRLISLNPGSQTPQMSSSAGTSVGGQPETIPPMGQSSAGITVSSQPQTIPPMGQTTVASDLSTGVLQGSIDGSCICPKCGTTVPHVRGTACYTIPCPRCGTLMVREGAVISRLGAEAQNTALTAQASAGTSVGGQPETIPPMGQSSAGITVAGPTTMAPGGPQQMMIPMGQASAGITVGGQPQTIPPMGQSSAGSVPGTTGTLNLNQQNQYCYCPICNTVYEHPPGVPCYSLVCPNDGSRLISLNPGSQTPQMSSSAGTSVGGQPQTIPPMGQSSAGITVAAPTTMAPGGQEQTAPRMGQSSTKALTTTPLTGSQTPLQGTAQRPYYAGAAKGQRDLDPPVSPTGQTSVGITVTGPTTMAPGGPQQMMVPMGQASAGTSIGGQPETIPPMGQTTALTANPVSLTATVSGESSGNICIASTDSDMDAQVAPLFDRAPYFLMVGLGSFRVVPNPNERDQTGVGIQSAQLIVSEGAKAVITNDIGVRGLEELSRLRVLVYTGVNGTARQALEWYQNGRLSPASLNTSNTEEEEHGPSSSKAKAKGESSRSL